MHTACYQYMDVPTVNAMEGDNQESPSELSCMVVTMARQFALLHNAHKFELLHMLSAILSSSKDSAPVSDALRCLTSKKEDDWAAYIRIGIIAVLQNRVASAEKIQALVLAESVMSIIGEAWLIHDDHTISIGDDAREPIPVDRCLWLVLETSRVKVAVLLNELAYLKYELLADSENRSSATMVDSKVAMKQQDLGVAFSLIEKIIKLISKVDCGCGTISEGTLMKVIDGLNETIGVVLEYLQDAKGHGQAKGDDLLASVRVIGSYLAEIPFACKDKVRDLLEYMLSVTSEDEPSPFYSVCFLLPMMCQMTMETEGCITLASFGGHKSVMDCLERMIELKSPQEEDTDAIIYLACDTIKNILLKIEKIPADQMGGSSSFVHLVRALTCWAEDANRQSVVMMMASSICSLIFDLTSEEALLSHPNFEPSTLNSLSRLVARSLVIGDKEMSDDPQGAVDLHQIVSTGYARWGDRFPHIKQAVQSMNH